MYKNGHDFPHLDTDFTSFIVSDGLRSLTSQSSPLPNSLTAAGSAQRDRTLAVRGGFARSALPSFGHTVVLFHCVFRRLFLLLSLLLLHSPFAD